MNRQKLVIFGTSKVADIVYSSMNDDPESKYDPVAFAIDDEYYCEDEKYELPIVRFENVEQKYPPQEYVMIIAMGYHEMNRIRKLKCEQARNKGYKLASFVHSDVAIPTTSKIGENVIILNNVSIGPFVAIGNNVCVYSGAVISHHTTIADNVWITSGTVIGGNSKVGENCFLGINSTIGHNVEIGSNNFIGANATVTKNTKSDSVYILPDTPKYRLNTEQFMRMFKFD